MDKPELKCPTCGYDLHGLQTDRDGLFRCPECGGLTDIMAMVDAHARRVRHDRRIRMALTVTFGLSGLVSVVSWLESLHWFRARPTLMVSMVLYFLLILMSWRRVANLDWRTALIWAFLTALMLSLPRTVLSRDSAWVLYPAGLAIFVGVLIWAGRRDRPPD